MLHGIVESFNQSAVAGVYFNQPHTPYVREQITYEL